MNKRMWATAALLCCALLAGCGGGGGDGQGGAEPGSLNGGAPEATAGAEPVPPQVPPTASSKHRLFVLESNYGTIAMLPQIELHAGAIPVQDSLTTSQLNAAIAYDSGRDVLYVTDNGTLRVYVAASSLASGATPTRTIELASGLMSRTSLQVDRAKDILYAIVVDRYSDATLFVFDGASSIQPGARPVRTVNLIGNADHMAIDFQRGLLYATGGTLGVNVYTGIDTAIGTIGPARSLITAFASGGIAVDAARDRLYVADFAGDGVWVVNGASQAVAKTKGDALVGIPQGRTVAVDSASDRLYVGAYNRAYMLENASGLGSAIAAPAAAAIAPAGTFIGGFAF